jgi:Domain of unknown function (DUF4926)
MSIPEHSTVVFLRDLQGQDVAAGDVGVIVHIHANEAGAPVGYLVETFGVDGESLDVVHCKAGDIRAVEESDRWHARSAA